MPSKIDIPLDVRYRKLLEDHNKLEKEFKEETKKRIRAEQRANELETFYPDQGLRVDRLEKEIKTLRARLRKVDQKK